MSGLRSILRIDRDGVLIAGEGPLAMLNTAAGGGVGQPLALPSVAALVRLARRLEIAVARTATLADGDHDIDLWVRVRPSDDETLVESEGAHGADGDGETHEAFDAAEADFGWQCDSAMTLTMLAPADAESMAAIGTPLTRAFDLSDDDGLVHLLSAAANRTGFADRPARVLATGRAVRLSGRSVLSASGAFAGFAGTGRFVVEAGEIDSSAVPGDAFADRLDRALRTPLQRIVAHADSIGGQTDGPLRSEYVEYAHDIASAARHLMGLVDDLVDLSAIERADFEVAIEPIDLADVARRAAGLLAVRADAAGITIERPDGDAVLMASGEYRRALQILVNLVGNAVRYSPRGSVVRLGLDRGAVQASVVVADEGRGIDRSDQARIFDKFGRVDPHEPGGNGLGLYIARRLARAMGGDITVDSALGQGARFTLTLPAA